MNLECYVYMTNKIIRYNTNYMINPKNYKE